MPYGQQLDIICAALLADRSVWVYQWAMTATTIWMGDLPASAAVALRRGGMFTICAGMSFSVVVSHATHSG